MRSRSLIPALVASAIVLGCGGSSEQSDTGGVEVIITTTPTNGIATIGASGGALFSPEGAGISFPPGALSVDQRIEIAESLAVSPSSMRPLGQTVDFLPRDLALVEGHPATIQLPLPMGTTAAVVYLSRSDESGWDLVGGASWAGSVKVDVSHLGTAFAAAP